MRTTVTLDQDVYEAAMQMAQASGQRFGKVLSELARRGLNPPAQHVQCRTGKSAWKFPTFKVPPGTPPISVEQVQKFLDEEGMF